MVEAQQAITFRGTWRFVFQLDERVYPGRIIPRLHRVPLPHWVRHAYRTLRRYLLRVHVLDPPSEGLCRSIDRRLDNPSVNWRIRLKDRYPGRRRGCTYRMSDG